MTQKDERLLPHEQRVVDEHNARKSELDKLRAFIKSDMFQQVEPEERARLVEQELVMHTLCRILYDRIAYFKRKAEERSA